MYALYCLFLRRYANASDEFDVVVCVQRDIFVRNEYVAL